jgi:hypothetical protein
MVVEQLEIPVGDLGYTAMIVQWSESVSGNDGVRAASAATGWFAGHAAADRRF